MESTYLTSIDERRGIQSTLFARNSRTLNIPEGLEVTWSDTLCKRAPEKRILNKNPATTVMVIDEVETDNWGIASETLSRRRQQGN